MGLIACSTLFCFTSPRKRCSFFSSKISNIFANFITFEEKYLNVFLVRFVDSSASSENHSFFSGKRCEALLCLCVTTAVKCFRSFKPTIFQQNSFFTSFETCYLLIFGILFCTVSGAKLSFACVGNYLLIQRWAQKIFNSQITKCK